MGGRFCLAMMPSVRAKPCSAPRTEHAAPPRAPPAPLAPNNRVSISSLSTGWFGWLYNIGAPGTMVGSNANALFIRGGAALATPNAIARILSGER